ncbi:MAG: ABC transporter permease [Kineosporiaceae bacterium]|nr:ABC transporter permease [Kineosporiaceae bacterium]
MSRRPSLGDRLLRVWGVAVFVFLFAPIAVVVAHSFNTGRLMAQWSGFGFDAYHAMLDKPAIPAAVWVSVRSGLIAAVVSTVLGTLAGIALARFGGRWSPPFVLLLIVLSVTPEIVDAVALLPWMVFLGQDVGLSPLDDGIVRLVIGHSLFATAVVTFLVRARLTGVEAHLEEASADLYAPPWRTFRKITLPLVMPAVLAGALLSFTLSLDNTVISAFVQVSGATPWPVFVLSALRSGLRPEIAAVSTVMMIFTLITLSLAALILRRAGDSATDIARTMSGT